MANMDSTSVSKREDAAIKRALRILENRIREPGMSYTSPDSVRQYLTLKMAKLEREVFTVLFLDTRNRLIADEVLFMGTITEANIYPREVVKRALQHNAVSLIVAHNHPSGCPDPSPADIAVTDRLKDALGLVSISLLDHFIIGGVFAVSLAEMGWQLPRAPVVMTDPQSEKTKRRKAKAKAA